MNEEEAKNLNEKLGINGSLKDDAAKLLIDLSMEEALSLNEVFLSRDEFWIDAPDNN